MDIRTKLLIVENDKAFVSSVITIFSEHNSNFDYNIVTDATSFEGALNNEYWDIILFGEGDPGFDIFSGIALIKGSESDIPVICICDENDEEKAIRAMRLGVRDYVTKDNLKRLIPIIDREISDVYLRKDKEVALEALAASEKKYNDLINTSPDVIYILTPKGTIASLSSVFEELTGWPINEVIGKKIRSLLHPEDFPLIAERFRKEMNGETIGTQRARIKTKTGGYVIAEFKSAPIVEKGGIIGVRGLARDVTERVRAEEALRESEEKYRGLTESSLSGIYIYQDSIIKFVNQKFCELSGYERDEAIGMPFWMFVHPDQREDIKQRGLARERGEDRKTQYELKAVTKENDIIWLDLRIAIIQYEGRPAVMGNLVNITDCKQAEKTLRETSDYLEKLLSYANAPIIVWDPGFKIRRFNHAFEHLTGYKANDVIGEKLQMLFPESSNKESLDKIALTSKGERWESVEIPILRADGKTRLALWNSANILAEDGKTIIATIAQGQDITERKRAEEELRETSDYLEKLLSYANAPIIVWDPRFKIRRFNHAFEHLTGYKADGVIGKKLQTLFPKSSKKESLDKIARASKGERWESVEIPILRADGKTRLALWNSANIFAEDGKTIVATIAQGQDITERKQTEDALRTSEERYRGLVESNPSAIAIHSVEGIILYVNESCLKIMGVTTDEIIGKSIFDFVYPDFHENISNRMKEIQNGGVISEAIAEKIIRLDGTTIDVEIVGTLITYKETTAIQVTFWDITERKQIEERLAESEERYRTLQSNIPVGIFRSDAELDGKVISANPAFAEMFGYESVEDVLNIKVADFYINPEDRTGFAKTMSSLGIVNNYEVKFKRRDGATFWGSISARAVKRADGNVSYFDGILKEITERKEMENALAASEKTYRSLYESNQALADVTDLETVIGVIARTARELLGATDSTLFLVNKDENVLIPLNVFPKTNYDAIMAFKIKIGEGLSGHVAETGEGIFINYDEEDNYTIHVPGTDFEEEDVESVIAVPMFEDNGEILGVITIRLLDGTFEKDDLSKLNFFARQAEIAIKRARFYDVLKESEEKYRGVVDKSLVGLFVNQDGKIKFANRRFSNIFGYTEPDEVIGENINDFVARESWEKIVHLGKIREAGETRQARYEFQAVKKDGIIFDVEALGSPIIYEGSPAIQGSIIDITERKRAEEALKRDRQAFAIIAEAAAETENTSDLSQRILDGLVDTLGFAFGTIRLYDEQNDLLKAAALTGFGDLETNNIKQPISIDDPNFLVAQVARKKEAVFAPIISGNEESKLFDKRFRGLGMQSIIYWPILDINNNLLGVIQLGSPESKEAIGRQRVFFESITRIFATVLEKKTADEKMLELRRAKDTLSDFVVHDIKNISSTMYSWIEMLAEGVLGNLTTDQIDAVERIVKQNDELFQLSEEMLDIARAEEGEINLNKNPYALDDQVLDVIGYYLPSAEKESKIIQHRFANESIIINADEARMKRVITNLIQNALKFAPPDSGEVFVFVRKDSNENTANIKISDNGPGIPEEYQALIFEKYSQTELKSRGLKKGHGLGLTYCKMIVEAHGGNITVESNGDNGSAFSVTIPLHQPE